VLPVPNAPTAAYEADRWDGVNVHDWSGTYGEYLLAKVAKVFPALLDDVIR
jgi:hypothetical protein